MVHDDSKGAGLEVKGQGVYRTASRREDMPPWGAAFTLAGQSTEHAEHRGAGVIRPLCLSGERYGLGGSRPARTLFKGGVEDWGAGRSQRGKAPSYLWPQPRPSRRGSQFISQKWYNWLYHLRNGVFVLC